MTSSFEGSGRQNRTSFELSSAGENKLVLDEIQYQIDFLKTKSSVCHRRKAALTLLLIFANPEKIMTHIVSTDIFVELAQLFESTDDVEILESVIAMYFVLLQNKDGSFNTHISLPNNAVKLLLQYHVPPSVGNYSRLKDLMSPMKTAQSESDMLQNNFNSNTTSPVKAPQASNATTSGLHRKRKFAGTAGAPSASASNSNNNTPVKLQKVLSMPILSPVAEHSHPLFDRSTQNTIEDQITSPIFKITTSAAQTPSRRTRENQCATPGTASKQRAAMESCGNIREAVRVLWPSVFSLQETNTSLLDGEEEHTERSRRDIDLLRMVLVNRHLLSTVSRLTTVSTSGHINSAGGDGDAGGSSAQDEEINLDEGATLLQTLTECQTLLREKPVTSSSTQHPTSSIASMSYLKRLCAQLSSDVQSLLTFMGSHGEATTFGMDVTLSGEWNRVYLTVGILEAACFRNSANQVYLSNIKLRLRLSQFSGSVSLPLPVILFELLRGLWPRMMFALHHVDNNTTTAAAARSSDSLRTDSSCAMDSQSQSSHNGNGDSFLRTNNTSSSASVGTRDSVDTFENEGAKLFPEMTASTASPNSRTFCAQALFVSCLEALISLTNHNPLACEQLANHRVIESASGVGNEAVRASSVTSTTSNGTNRVYGHSQSQQSQDSQYSQSSAHDEQVEAVGGGPGCVSFLVSLLAYFITWRQTHQHLSSKKEKEKKTTKNDDKGMDSAVPSAHGVLTGHGALSLTETVTERHIFDCTLYLLSLFTNIAESSSRQTASTSSDRVGGIALNVDVIESLTSHSVVMDGLPQATLSQSRTMGSSSALLVYLTNSCDDKSVPPRSDLLELLVSLVRVETATFLQDIEETDQAINECNERIEAAAAQSNGGKKTIENGSSSSADGSSKPAVSDSDAVPIAELILSSHAILLIHTLTVVTISNPVTTNASSTDLTVIGRRNTGDSHHEDNAEEAQQQDHSTEVLLYDVRDRLPRGSFWLCIRVLKAFMQLQLQTGILLLESVTPVLEIIHSMTQQDALLLTEKREEEGGRKTLMRLENDEENSWDQQEQEDYEEDKEEEEMGQRQQDVDVDDWLYAPVVKQTTSSVSRQQETVGYFASVPVTATFRHNAPTTFTRDAPGTPYQQSAPTAPLDDFDLLIASGRGRTPTKTDSTAFVRSATAPATTPNRSAALAASSLVTTTSKWSPTARAHSMYTSRTVTSSSRTVITSSADVFHFTHFAESDVATEVANASRGGKVATYGRTKARTSGGGGDVEGSAGSTVDSVSSEEFWSQFSGNSQQSAASKTKSASSSGSEGRKRIYTSSIEKDDEEVVGEDEDEGYEEVPEEVVVPSSGEESLLLGDSRKRREIPIPPLPPVEDNSGSIKYQRRVFVSSSNGDRGK